MIVDDNVDFAFSLGEILKDENYETECLHSGEEALERFRQQKFDLVLLDMKLPRISGIEVLLEMRRIDPAVKVLMMSGHSVTDLLAQAVDGGMHRIFYPPYKTDSLLTALRAIDGSGMVLVIDDNPDLAKNIEETLSADGLSVFVAADGREAFEKLSENGCDMLVLDQQTQIIRGLEIYWKLKLQDHSPPTVIVTPAPKELYLTIEKLNQFPVCGYFIKPFDPFELLPALEALNN